MAAYHDALKAANKVGSSKADDAGVMAQFCAAELRRLADWHFPSEPNSREGEAVCAVLNALRGRADELERGTR